MACKASLADERIGTEHPDDPFLPLIGHHAEFNLAFLDVKDRVAIGALPEDKALGFVRRDGSARSDRGQKFLCVERFERDLGASPFPGRFLGRAISGVRFFYLYHLFACASSGAKA
jgi:hypothetical protein